MKQMLFILCLLSTGLSAQNTTDDHIRARSSFRIGSTSSTAGTGIANTMPGTPGTQLITAAGVYNWATGTLTFSGDVSGLYNNLTLANSGVTAGTCTNCSLTIDGKGRVTVKGSGSAGATYTAGSGIAISGGNEISNTAPDQIVAISGASGIYPNFTLPTKEDPLTFSNGLNRSGNAVTSLISNSVNGLAVTINGALSQPAMTGTGTWITGGSTTTNKPYALIEPTGATSAAWSTAATGLGVNAPSGFTGNVVDFQLNGVSRFRVSSAGLTTSFAGITMSSGDLNLSTGGSEIVWAGRIRAEATASGNFRLKNSAGNDFGLFQLGGTSSSYPAVKRVSAGINFVVADDSAFAATQSLYDRFGSGSPEGVISAPVGAVYHRTDGGTGTAVYFKETGGTGNTGWVAK